MTREEAKAILENDIVDGHVEGNARFMDAFWMAVDALSQEPICDRDCEHCTWTECPIEPCDDMISRDAINNLQKYRYNCGDTSITCVSLASINTLPSVTPSIDLDKHDEELIKETVANIWGKEPSRRKGHWIDYSDEGYVECPFCGHATTCEDNIDELHYCFYCGARMESEE